MATMPKVYSAAYMREYRAGYRRDRALYLAVVEAARDMHDERCGCMGEACQLGAALAEVAGQQALPGLK